MRLPIVLSVLTLLSTERSYAQDCSRQRMDYGYRLLSKGDFRGALSLAAQCPDNADAEAIQGWAQFKRGQLGTAEMTMRVAIEHVAEGNHLQGLAYLGAILETRGDKAGAIASYRKVLELVPDIKVPIQTPLGDSSDIVIAIAARARLKTLDPVSFSEATAIEMRHMLGPFPSVAAYCEQLEVRDSECGCLSEPDIILRKAVPRPSDTFMRAQLFQTYHSCRSDEGDIHVAVQLIDGWYVGHSIVEGSTYRRCVVDSPKVNKLAVNDLLGTGVPQLELRYNLSYSCGDKEAYWTHLGTILELVTLTEGRKPVMTPVIELKSRDNYRPRKGAPSQGSTDFRLSFGKDTIKFSGTSSGTSKAAAFQVGTYQLIIH